MSPRKHILILLFMWHQSLLIRSPVFFLLEQYWGSLGGYCLHVYVHLIQQWRWAPASSVQNVYRIITMLQIIWMEEFVLHWTEHPTNSELADRKGKLREVLHWDVKNIILGCFTRMVMSCNSLKLANTEALFNYFPWIQQHAYQGANQQYHCLWVRTQKAVNP